ncbi:MAG: hypothetical protein Q4B85_08060 [Lachnospiraceae bacterium]|nr:hypothetical protein [Lachnospiraceae bacterium]
MAYDLLKEKREAIEAGNRALDSLLEARKQLNSAKNWGLWDMFGGGIFSSMIKHSKIDRAKQNLEMVKYDLKRFSEELEDVRISYHLSIDIGDFLTFADWFFDGFFVDWMVQDKINQSLEQVEEAIMMVEEILQELTAIDVEAY